MVESPRLRMTGKASEMSFLTRLFCMESIEGVCNAASDDR